MQIFPKLLLRIGGDTFENLETLTPPKTISLTNTLYHHHSLAEAAKNQLSDFLYNYNPTLSSTDDQNLLLNLRRDIYNDREVNDDDIAACKNLIPDDQKELLSQYFENRAQLEKIIESGEETHAEEIALLRKRFQEITGKDGTNASLSKAARTSATCVTSAAVGQSMTTTAPATMDRVFSNNPTKGKHTSTAPAK